MRKFLVALIAITFLNFPSFAINSTEEIINPDENRQFLEGYIEATDDDIIRLDTDFCPKYKTDELKNISTYSKSLEEKKDYNTLVNKGVFSVNSKSYSYNDSNTLIKNVRQELGATVKKDRFSLTGGFETTYDTTNINQASRGAFITPKLQLNERTAISIKNKVPWNSLNKYEPTFGIDYKPKSIKNSSFSMGAGATIQNNNVESQTLNFKTNFYLF